MKYTKENWKEFKVLKGLNGFNHFKGLFLPVVTFPPHLVLPFEVTMPIGVSWFRIFGTLVVFFSFLPAMAIYLFKITEANSYIFRLVCLGVIGVFITLKKQYFAQISIGPQNITYKKVFDGRELETKKFVNQEFQLLHDWQRGPYYGSPYMSGLYLNCIPNDKYTFTIRLTEMKHPFSRASHVYFQQLADQLGVEYLSTVRLEKMTD